MAPRRWPSSILPVHIAWVLMTVAMVSFADDRLTPEQVQQVARFRPLVQDLIYKDWMNSDEYLIRWLRARGGNPRGAREMLKSALEWRKSNRIDGILTEDFSDVEREFTVVLEGEDRQGHPLVFFNLGALDFRKLAIGGRLQKTNRYFFHLLELVEHVLRLKSSENGTFTRAFLIADLHGFSVRQHACVQCIPFGVSIFGGFESYYPDRAYRFFGVNAPRAVIPFINVARSLASDTSLGVLYVFDNDREKWKKALLDEIDEDQLPLQFGGTRQVKSKTGCVLFDYSAGLPKSFGRVECNFAFYLQEESELNSAVGRAKSGKLILLGRWISWSEESRFSFFNYQNLKINDFNRD